MVDIAVVSATAPVFVDPGGRRRRVLTAVGVGGALLLATYLLALIAALTGAPWVPAIGLPGVDAPAAVVPTPDAIASAGLIGRVTESTGSGTAAPAVGDGGSAADPSSTPVTTPSAVPPPAASAACRAAARYRAASYGAAGHVPAGHRAASYVAAGDVAAGDVAARPNDDPSAPDQRFVDRPGTRPNGRCRRWERSGHSRHDGLTSEAEAWRRRSPRAHWILLGLVGLAIGATLVVSGYTSGDTSTGTANPSDSAPAGEPFTSAGPVLDLRGDELQSVATPAKTVVLTFDDGPDPEWTPAVLDVLARHGVRATFFVVGQQVTAHPDLVRAEIAAGHEVGAHTYNHPDLSTLPAWRVNLELSLSQSVLAGATGRHVGLFRPPYSSTPDALDVDDVEVLQQVADRGYLTVVADLDSGDWRRPGIEQIVADATPAGEDGAIVLFHDGGGDRVQTVAAVDRLISDLQGRGYEFATVGELLDGGDGAVMAEVGARQEWQGRVAIAVIKASQAATRLLALSLVPIGILAVARAVIVGHQVRRIRRRRVVVGRGAGPVGQRRGAGLQRGGGHRGDGPIVAGRHAPGRRDRGRR